MFDRLLGRQRSRPPWTLDGFSGSRLYPLPGGALLGIVGERHHHQEVVRTLRSAAVDAPGGLDERARGVAQEERGTVRWFPVELIPAPANPYDENAIEVRTVQGLVGYIDRDHAVEYRPVFEALRRGGYDGGVVAGFGRLGENQIVLCLSFADICSRQVHDDLVCKSAWEALCQGADAASVAKRFEFSGTGPMRRSVRSYARRNGLPDPEAKA